MRSQERSVTLMTKQKLIAVECVSVVSVFAQALALASCVRKSCKIRSMSLIV